MASIVRPPFVLGFAIVVSAACGPAGSELGEVVQALETFENQEPAFDYFVAKGLTETQSAGIVGNLSAESGVDPTIRQLGGGPGRGLAQWQVGGRWDTTSGDNVLDYAAEQGADPLSLPLQLDFIWYELTEFPSYGLTKLRATTTAGAAAISFATNFEGCPACDSSKRVQYANDVLARFGAGSGPGSSSGQPAAEPCLVDATGDEGECLTTSECAALGSHVSTPGYCPGADDVQCCTPLVTTADGGSPRQDASSGGVSSSGADPVDPAGADHGEPAAEGGCSSASSGSPAGVCVLFVAALGLSHRRRRRPVR